MKLSISLAIILGLDLPATTLFHATCLAQGCSTPNFDAALTFSAGYDPVSVAVGDFNGDGAPDLAVANAAGGTSAGNVPVLLGNGDGTFQEAVNYRAGTGPDSVVVGDFNGDGKLDLAVANPPDGTISVLLGNGDGTFQTASNYDAGTHPARLAVGDFNRDGKLDLVVAGFGFSVLLGNGNGTFQDAVSHTEGTNYVGVAVGDFNGDGKADVALVVSGGFAVSVLFGKGDGAFGPAVDYPVGAVGNPPHGIAIGDFNGDGKADLATANTASVSVLMGKGDGTFQGAVYYETGQPPINSVALAVGDFNGDGRHDLAVANSTDATVSAFLGNGDGTFQPPVSFYVGLQPAWVALGDFNGDGSPDLAVATRDFSPPTGYVAVLLNTCVAPAPTLSVVPNKLMVAVSWPFPSSGFVLESTLRLTSPNWQPAAETPTTNNNRLIVTVPTSQNERYFRLHKR